MSTQETEPTESPTQESEAGKPFEAITSQDALDKIVTARLARERAKFADYDELKAKAAQADQASEAQKIEAKQLADRAAAAERELEERSAQLERANVIAAHAIPVEFQDLVSGTGEALETSAKKIAQLVKLSQRGPYLPSEGIKPSQPQRPADPLR